MIWHAIALTLSVLQTQGNLSDIPAKYGKPAPEAGKVLAKVNGVEIKASDVQDLLWQSQGANATNDLILYLLVKQDAQKKGVAVTDPEVDTALTDRLGEVQTRLQPGDTVEAYMLRQGFSISRLFLRTRMELLAEKVLSKNLKPEAYVKVSTMIVRPASPSSADIANAAKKAEDLYARLKKGESWESVLRLASPTEARALQVNGLLGWRETSAFPEPTQTELSKLKAGGITPPVQTPNGMQIFRLEAQGVNASKQDLAELRKQYVQAMMTPYFAGLEKEAKIERFLP